MAGIYDIVDALKAMGAELRARSEEADDATKKVARYVGAAKEAARLEVTAGMSNEGKGGDMGASSTGGASSAGSTTDSKKLGAAILAAAGRTGK